MDPYQTLGVDKDCSRDRAQGGVPGEGRSRFTPIMAASPRNSSGFETRSIRSARSSTEGLPSKTPTREHDRRAAGRRRPIRTGNPTWSYSTSRSPACGPRDRATRTGSLK